MVNKRKKYTEPEERILFNQVDGICPLCAKNLHFDKDGGLQKKYEIAHIYPLNPKADERQLLEQELRLSLDPNDIDNVILLCVECHTMFDKPRTVEEYRRLFRIKKRLINEDKLRSTYYSYTVEEDIIKIIDVLSKNTDRQLIALDYNVLKIDQKLNEDIHMLVRQRIKGDVSQYYLLIQSAFSEIDKNASGTFDLIASQIHTYYKKVATLANDQELIYEMMAEWLSLITKVRALDACKVIISFFIQNCEVFSDATQ